MLRIPAGNGMLKYTSNLGNRSLAIIQSYEIKPSYRFFAASRSDLHSLGKSLSMSITILGTQDEVVLGISVGGNSLALVWHAILPRRQEVPSRSEVKFNTVIPR